MMESENILAFDCSTFPPSLKHPAVIKKLESLKPGESLNLITDHDPKSLQHELIQGNNGSFVLTYIASGPGIWKIEIKKLS
jgi:uncharacterized protein (DUF2249 family)